MSKAAARRDGIAGAREGSAQAVAQAVAQVGE